MPRKQCHTRVRNRGHVRLNKDTRMVCLFACRQTQGEHYDVWAFITVSQRHAETEEAEGRASRVLAEVDGEIVTVGWRSKQDYVPGKPTPALLDDRTMEAVANGKNSQLTPGERRQFEKYVAWPLIGDTKAVCVRPRISDADRQRAELLLRRRAA